MQLQIQLFLCIYSLHIVEDAQSNGVPPVTLISLTEIIIKTCGTTKLLLAIPPILKLAGSLSLTLKIIWYTRGSFNFPASQPYPHRNFTEKVAILDKYFGNIGAGSKACLIGGRNSKQQWHVYSAAAASVVNAKTATYTIEMCISGLDTEKDSVFYKKRFCSGSMTSISEDGYSYASFECAGYDLKKLNLNQLVYRVLSCFEPINFSFAVRVDGSAPLFEETCPKISGYFLTERSIKDFGDGGFYHLYEVQLFGWARSDPLLYPRRNSTNRFLEPSQGKQKTRSSNSTLIFEPLCRKL
ncbi:hypothetical protein V6N13_080069 [Hibiscus sabdariffa]|uniref:Adenosylmethionine decarboxylase n=1 Tax=Hibiscus sabdariffa TaxID=183260 RepID=A0ABR2RTJ0_9ROSI